MSSKIDEIQKLAILDNFVMYWLLYSESFFLTLQCIPFFLFFIFFLLIFRKASASLASYTLCRCGSFNTHLLSIFEACLRQIVSIGFPKAVVQSTKRIPQDDSSLFNLISCSVYWQDGLFLVPLIWKHKCNESKCGRGHVVLISSCHMQWFQGL